MRLGGNVPVFRWIGAVNGAIVNVMEFLRIAPRGMGDVHKMLFDTGGERPGRGRGRLGLAGTACGGRGVLLLARWRHGAHAGKRAGPWIHSVQTVSAPVIVLIALVPTMPAPAVSIMEGGIEGIFTPMHMLVFQKPEEPAAPAAPAAAQ